MRRWAPVLLIICLLLGFIIIAQAIISVKFLELRVKISRERILNYELSSKVLKQRFVHILESEKKGFNSEVTQNVLEAAIMNDKDPEALELTKGEYAGLLIINIVRKLSFKPFLYLMADQEQLLLMKYAFFMERNRRYDQASRKYLHLEKLMTNDNSDARGFVMLHHGYCLAVSGKKSDALKLLYTVRDDFSGSHYSQTAIVLINLLLASEDQKKQIDNLELDNLQKARKYFAISLYKSSIQLYNKENNLLPIDQYRLARSQEETGAVPKAIQGYLAIVKSNKDSEAVKLANRRLLLIGNFYGGGKKVKEFAEKKAKDIGDDSAIKEIKVAVQNRRKDIILEEIKEQNKKTDTTDPLFAQLGKELEENIVLDEKITKPKRMNLAHPKIPELSPYSANIHLKEMDFKNMEKPESYFHVKSAQLKLADPGQSARMFPNARMLVKLKDGREFQCHELLFKENSVLIVDQALKIEIPLLVIKDIKKANLDNSASKTILFLVLKDGKRIKILKVESIKDKEISIIDEGRNTESYDMIAIEKILFP